MDKLLFAVLFSLLFCATVEAQDATNVAKCVEGSGPIPENELLSLENVCREALVADPGLLPLNWVLAKIEDVKGNKEHALRLAIIAAEAGVVQANQYAGFAYVKGTNGAIRSTTLAIPFLTRAAEQGDEPSALQLAGDYARAGNARASLVYSLILAEHGHLYGQYNAAEAYLKGLGTGVDNERGWFWAEKVVDQKNYDQLKFGKQMVAFGYSMLATKYLFDPQSQDFDRALQLLARSEELGNAKAGQRIAELKQTIRKEENSHLWVSILSELFQVVKDADPGDVYKPPASQPNYACEGAMSAYAWSGKPSGMEFLC